MGRATKGNQSAPKPISEIEPNYATLLYMYCPGIPPSSQRGNSPSLPLHVATCYICQSEWAYMLTMASFDRYTS